MDQYLSVLALALPPSIGCFVGGLLTEAFPISKRLLSLVLHAAAGVVLAVVSVELMPQAMRTEAPWVVILAFVTGGGFFILLDQWSQTVADRFAGNEGSAGPSAIYFGVVVDLFTDGITVGTGSTISVGLALLLSLSQVPANIPTGFVSVAAFKRLGASRRTRVLLSASFAVPVLLGATVGFWAVQGQPELLKLALLAFTAGILTTVVVEEMVPEAHRHGDARLATIMFVGGFALFALISAYFG
jgi:ZIP family zinc transporter